MIATDGCFNLSRDAVVAYAARKGMTFHVVGPFFVTHKYAHMPAEVWGDVLARAQAARSDEAQKAWIGEYNTTWFSIDDIAGDDPDLVAVVEHLGDAAAGQLASLTIVDVPDDVKWHIAECCGTEWVAENHRRWGID